MKVMVNGNLNKYDAEHMFLDKLIGSLKIKDIERIIVDINGNFLEKSDYNSTSIKDGDKIEILYFMGGG